MNIHVWKGTSNNNAQGAVQLSKAIMQVEGRKQPKSKLQYMKLPHAIVMCYHCIHSEARFAFAFPTERRTWSLG